MNPQAAAPAVPAGRDVSLSKPHAVAIALGLLPLLAAAVFVPFGLVWGWERLWDGTSAAYSPVPFLLGIAVTVVVHEGLHAAGFLLFGRVERSALHFGFDWKALAPFAGCRVAMPAAAYRGAVLLPAAVLGVVPWIASMAVGSGWLAAWAFAMLAVAGGDLAAWWAMRSVPAAEMVVDHPTRVGCMAVAA
jgi:hypothetical protein